MSNKNKKLPPKVLSFSINNPDDVRLFTLLDKTRYNQSKFIKRLLSDFYAEFNITEETPYKDLCYIVKAYIDRDKTYNQYQVLNQIINRGSSSIQQDISVSAPTTENSVIRQTPSNDQPTHVEIIEDDGENQYIGTMASGFASLLDN